MYIKLLVNEMSIFLQEDIEELQYCMQQTYLREPRLHIYGAAKRCGISLKMLKNVWVTSAQKSENKMCEFSSSCKFRKVYLFVN